MGAFLRRWGGPGITFFIGLGFELIAPIESTTLAVVAWAVAAVWAAYLTIPKVRELWSGIKKRWPFALARTANQLNSDLRESESENEQLKQENKNLQVDLDAVGTELGITKKEKAKLREQCENLTAEVGQLTERNQELRNQRDWQIRMRCGALAESLHWFLQRWDRQDPKNQEALSEYNTQFKSEVSGLIDDLKTFDLWSPEIDIPDALENPENRQDVEKLTTYLRLVSIESPE